MIPLNDPRRINKTFDFSSIFNHFVSGGRYILGDNVRAFEREFAAYCGVANCVSCGNGTDALTLAMMAFGVERGYRVATVANAGGYASCAIKRVGAMPVYVDIDEHANISPADLERVIDRVDLVIVTHLYGRMANMPELLTVAGNTPVIEDCCQAHGAVLNGKRAGAFGVMGCFSFYPTKPLGALGDGGAVVTSNSALYYQMQQIRQYGWANKYNSVQLGFNSRLDELQAAVLRAKLPHVDEWNRERRDIASKYDVVGRHYVSWDRSGTDNVWHLYSLNVANRDEFIQRMTVAGIGTDIHYPIPDYKMNAYATGDKLQATEAHCQSVVTLPIFAGMTEEEIEAVCQAIKQCQPL
jgi:dTDP-3-amino-2,3,6-trideoxy-4-keto-D-glucose/dTDP-3-amino-3,4,6-trideoxy-alpha-D-glucose/dTDP-2,6-dideoxy-D-kanosamine transaminase